MPRCVVFSERAFISLLVETQEKITTETGGVFLGYRKGDIWYVVESIDPGPKSIFQPAYFEYDQAYVNHLINKVSRIYKTQLDLIGLWHRHPGSFDCFSGTDDVTNTSFAEIDEDGTISGLVNIDPNFRLTMYEVKLPLKYKKIPIVVGDVYIPYDLLALRNPIELQKQMDSDGVSSRVKKFSLLKPKKEDDSNVNEISRIAVSDFSLMLQIMHLFEKEEHISESNLTSFEEIEKNVEQILIELNEDLSFFHEFDISCEMEIESADAVKCLLSDKDKKASVEFLTSHEVGIVLRYKKKLYKYHRGLFLEMYKRVLEEDGV